MNAAGAGLTRNFCPQVGILRKADGQLAWYKGFEKESSSVAPTSINLVSALMKPSAWVVAPENRAAPKSQVYPPADWEAYRSVVRFFAQSQCWVNAFEGQNEPDDTWRGRMTTSSSITGSSGIAVKLSLYSIDT